MTRTRRPSTYTSKDALAVIARMLAAMENGPVSTTQLTLASCRTGSRAQGYIVHLAGIGQIYQYAPPQLVGGRGGRNKPALWALDPRYTEASNAGPRGFTRHVVVKDHVPGLPAHRDPLVAALFGAVPGGATP